MKQVIHVNKPEETLNVGYDKFFGEYSTDNSSPIDKFYEVCSELVKLTKPETLQSNTAMSRLLILGFVSAVEEYLRSIFTQLIHLSPCARSAASKQTIKFGSLDYYEQDGIAAALFDQTAFSSQDEVKKKMENLLGINIGSSLSTAMKELEKVFHLRHCAVHGGGVLNGHNADHLGLDKTYVKRQLQPDSVELQTTLKICFSFVRAFNQHVFSETLNCWRGKKLSNLWKDDKWDFDKLISLFWSYKDMGLQANVRSIYGTIVKVPTAMDVYSYDDGNHAIISSIIQKCVTGEDQQKIASHLEILDKDERHSVLKFLVSYDDEFCRDVLTDLIQSSTRQVVVLQCINFMSEHFAPDENHIPILRTILHGSDEELKVEAMELLSEKYGSDLSQVYPDLIQLQENPIMTILERWGVMERLRGVDVSNPVHTVIMKELPEGAVMLSIDVKDETVRVRGDNICIMIDYEIELIVTSGEEKSLIIPVEIIFSKEGDLQPHVSSAYER